MGKLSEEEISQALAELPLWQRDGQALRRELQLPSFTAVMELVNRVAQAAEAADHHPDIDIRYNKVVFRLISHDSGGITKRDVRMARTIDELAGASS